MDNELRLSKSLYLQQHSENPVHWKRWQPEIWKEAQQKNKLVIVSIGYSSCHWCHVMERESFERQDVADVMNAHFISIKVDREERPDIDSIYMTAVQLMAGQGGWPLNVVCLPDKRPIWGGTYFPREKWMNTLLQIHKLYQHEPLKVIKYADELEEGLRNTELLPSKDDSTINTEWLNEREQRVLKMRDSQWGGYQRAPKFPMPFEQLFHLMAADVFGLPKLHQHILFTLHKMADGGIYDIVGGGFCRYAVDGRWKVPHFEKMLYDNAQLLSTYAIAYRRTKSPQFLDVINGINRFLNDVFRTEDNLYQSAIDADSEGVEGQYYTWTTEELQSICGEDMDVLRAVYELDDLWEGRCILFRIHSNVDAAKKLKTTPETISTALNRCHEALQNERRQRTAPAIDHKIIAGWNGLLISGFVDAYLASGQAHWKQQAADLASALENHLCINGVWHRIFASGEAYISAHLEDISALAQGFMALYQCSGHEHWYTSAQHLINQAILHFSDPDSPFFFTTSQQDEAVIQRNRDLEDNVIPSPNALMADAIRRFTTVHHNEDLDQRWRSMTQHAASISREVKSGFYLWGMLYLHTAGNRQKEWVISGSNAQVLLEQAAPTFHDFHTELFVLNKEKPHDLFRGRFTKQTQHFVCEGRQCHQPTTSIEEARAHCKHTT